MYTTLTLYQNGKSVADCGPNCHDASGHAGTCLCKGTNYALGADHAVKRAANLAYLIGRWYRPNNANLRLVVNTVYNCSDPPPKAATQAAKTEA